MSANICKVAVVGGGISGLAAAYHLIELSNQSNFPLEVLIMESSERVGGAISTLKKEGCILELGPDAIFTEKPWGIDFCKKVGLENELVGTNPNCRNSFIFFNGKLLPVPNGFYLLAPSQYLPLLVSSIFSLRGKLRMLCEPFMPVKENSTNLELGGDESLASFVRRRLGKEVLERMAQPMVGGIYSADPEQLSLKATFPRFLELEQKYGSVIRGLQLGRSLAKTKNVKGPRYQLFVSLKEGMQFLIEKVVQKMPAGSVRLGTNVKKISKLDGTHKQYKVVGDNFESEVDAICLSTPTFQTAKMVRELDAELSVLLEKIVYSGGITINFVYNKKDIPHSLNGFGFVVPEIEHKIISGCTYSSVKFTNRCSDDKVILRAFLGGKKQEDIFNLEDKEIEKLVKAELNQILDINTDPYFSIVSRHPNSLPQYYVGHLQIVEKIEERIKELSGIELAGNGYYGTGIPDCIHSGELAAEKIFNDLMRR